MSRGKQPCTSHICTPSCCTSKPCHALPPSDRRRAAPYETRVDSAGASGLLLCKEGTGNPSCSLWRCDS